MIKFTPKVKPSNRITDIIQLGRGHTYLVDNKPYIFCLNNGIFHFTNLKDGEIDYNPRYTLRDYTVVPADFELIEIDEAGA